MKRITFLFVILLFTSCEYFEKKKVYTDDLLQEELKTFNWNEVDTYPTFEACEQVTDKVASKRCFQQVVLQHVNQYLKDQHLVVTTSVNDTINLSLAINHQGQIEVQNIKSKEETERAIPHIDSLLRESVMTLPKIYPAIKRGQQVKTVFKLPIVVKITE